MLILALAGVAALGWAALLVGMPRVPSPVAIPWPLLAVGFAIAEIFVMHLEFRSDSHSFSLNEVPLVLGLFFVSPAELILAQALGAGFALAVHRRQPVVKLAFNVANAAVGTIAALVIFHGAFGFSALFLAAPDVVGPVGWTATLLAVVAADQLVASNVVTAISISQPGAVNRRQIVTIGTLFGVANTCLALVAVVLLWLHPVAVLLPVALSVVLVLAYRAYAAELRKRKSMDMLVESTRIAHDSARIESVTRTLLTRAREMFDAERAEMLLVNERDDAGSRFSLNASDEFTMETVPAAELAKGSWPEVAQGHAVRLVRPMDDDRQRHHYAERGLRDVIAAPIRRGDEIIGKMLVGNRRSDVASFSRDDLHLFETLANHASVSLQNGRLVDELRLQLAENRHQAMHDSLTGLPNRTLFQQRLDEAVAARHPRRHVAVLLMDLNRFKEVNDTLGHYFGDQLLKEVAKRLQAAVGNDTTVARLSGDEFGFLIGDLDDAGQAVNAAKQMLDVLEAPFLVEELTLQVGASIGVALCPQHGEDADALLQRADVAMYVAKEARAGVELYAPERDQHSPARLALSGEIRRALERDELLVFYQPKVDFEQRLLGMEALVRWQHPRRGLILPGEFVPMAEHTGLIRPLTLHVIEEAVRQCHEWRRDGHDLHVAVNLSVRSLLDAELPEGIAAILQRYPIPASSLTLEITESMIMADTTRTDTILTSLDEMGLHLSIDDFGTGLSSYERLQRLPVDELKIDRSFVVALDAGGKADMIVRSIIDLGHNLGLGVVGEGVETPTAWNALREFGCDAAQGYLTGRPMSAQQFTKVLASPATPRIMLSPRSSVDRAQPS
jgi:diguanylate cyclase (GGDEF)-like protein